MDFLTAVAVLVLVLVVFVFIMRAGFWIRPRSRMPMVESLDDVTESPLPPGLPEVVRHYFSENIGDPALAPHSITAWGRGWLSSGRKFFTTNLWLPTVWEAHLIPGEGFLLKTEVTWYGRRFFNSTDVFYQGKAQFSAGTTKVANENVNRGEEIAKILFTWFLSPGSLLLRPGIRWIESSTGEIEFSIPAAQGEDLRFTLYFDPEKAELARVDTLRPTARGGKLLPYRGEYSAYQQNMEGIFLPTTLLTVWEDEPYSRLMLEGIRYNTDVRDLISVEAPLEVDDSENGAEAPNP